MLALWKHADWRPYFKQKFVLGNPLYWFQQVSAKWQFMLKSPLTFLQQQTTHEKIKAPTYHTKWLHLIPWLHVNNFEIISLLYFTRNHRRWLRVKYNNEIISKLFQCFISRVTTPEIISKLFQPLQIISKLFQRHWTCWKISMSCNRPLK